MSLTTHQYNRRDNRINNNSNSGRRRYIIEPSINSTNHQQPQIKRQNNIYIPPTRNSLTTNNTEEYLTYNQNGSSINEDIDDPCVKYLLERDIDFSKLYQDGAQAQVELLRVPNIKPIPHPRTVYQTNKRPSQIVINKSTRPNRSSLTSSSQCKLIKSFLFLNYFLKKSKCSTSKMDYSTTNKFKSFSNK